MGRLFYASDKYKQSRLSFKMSCHVVCWTLLVNVEAAVSTRTSIPYSLSTWQHTPQCNFLYIHHSDNLISHTVMFMGGCIVLNCSDSNWVCVILHNQFDYLLRISRFEINYSQIYEKFCILFCVWIYRCIVKSDFTVKFSSIWQSCA